MKKLIMILLGLGLSILFLTACQSGNNQQATALYTCPMPQDSVFSDKPGKCPKCGMTLIKVENHEEDKKDTEALKEYTCPMHPQIQSDTQGSCPICGMQLEKTKSPLEPKAVSLNTLLKPVNQQVVASVPMVHMMEREEDIEMESYGFINYDTRQVGAIAATINGRIEKLYVKYRYQQVEKGQKIMDIYSPELLTAQENLLFIAKNDPENSSLLNAARQKLLLLGMSNNQLDKVVQTGKAAFTVSIYSNYSGHVHESGSSGNMQQNPSQGMSEASLITNELAIKEGMYVKKGQTIFSVFNPRKAWAILNIFAGQATMVKTGDRVRIIPETAPQKDFAAIVNYIEPFYREGSKTLTARVYFDNSKLNIPIGSQVRATIFAGNRSANWLPEEAVLSLGLEKVVFVRKGEAFSARKIETGIVNKHLVQILAGLDENEAVAANAQYLVDSESFIKTN